MRHVTTQLLTWQGPPESLDSLSVLLEFHNGMSGTLATVRVTPVTWRLHVFGTEGNAEKLHDQIGLVHGCRASRSSGAACSEADTLRLELEAFAGTQWRAGRPIRSPMTR